MCTITCSTYYGSTLTGTATCTLTLNVPLTIVPSLSFTFSEATAGINEQFHCYLRTWGKLSVTITAAGSQGSSISSYRATVNGATYTTASFTTGVLNNNTYSTYRLFHSGMASPVSVASGTGC